jgi:hygromycin-B 7''-O-kinase
MFPYAETPDAWAALRADDAALRAGVAAICARYRLGGEPIRRYSTGTQPVYAIGANCVLKLFPPPDSDGGLAEEDALAAVAGRLPVATPQVLGSGEMDGWRYVLMTQLEGRLLSDAWPDIPAADRDRFGVELGETLAALHGIDTSPLDRLKVDWPAFLQRQRDTAVEHQRERGLAARWLQQIPEFLDTWMPAAEAPRALLHTELMREHLLVAPRKNRWELTGLFDFEPAMVGAAEYDLAAYGLFVSAGNSRLFGRTLRAYGRSDAIGDDAFARRILAYTLLHRYSNLSWYLQRMPPAPHERDLDALAERWFGATFDE